MKKIKKLAQLLLYLGIPIVIIIIIVLVIGNMPQKTMKYSEILNYFETQQVTEFDLDLGSGAWFSPSTTVTKAKRKSRPRFSIRFRMLRSCMKILSLISKNTTRTIPTQDGV